MNNDDIKNHKLDTIVGAALRALFENGADDTFIGSFAASHRRQVAELLGVAELPPQPPELLSLVTQAVNIALENHKPKRELRTRRLNVLIDGHRTSITINISTEKQLTASYGEKAIGMIQDIASKAPSNVKNKSKWVEERIQSVLAFGDQHSMMSQKH